MTNAIRNEEKNVNVQKREPEKRSSESSGNESEAGNRLTTLQQQIGNRAVQRLLVQRAGDGAFDLDDETAVRINRERSGGQSLDSTVQAKMSDATGQDLSGVRVHTGPESHALNERLNAKAFTTGQDIFFREGAYDPGSTGGQELLAHELTHVVQQSSGRVGSTGGRMAVNAPGDAFEQEADSVAKSVKSGNAAPEVQRAVLPEDKDALLQKQETDEEPEEEL